MHQLIILVGVVSGSRDERCRSVEPAPETDGTRLLWKATASESVCTSLISVPLCLRGLHFSPRSFVKLWFVLGS
jgi:hypothetical protein